MNELPAGQAAADLSAVIGTVKRGTLRMFGDWFGRPMDNIHEIRSVSAQGRDLIVRFNHDEEITISDPEGWEFTAETFCVRHASRVVWRWYSYGRPKQPEYLLTIEHSVDEQGEISARSDENWYEPHFQPSSSDPAAELL